MLIKDEESLRRRRPAWPTALALLLCGLAIGALAEPRAWLDALHARLARGETLGRLEPVLRARTAAEDVLPDNRLASLSIDIAEGDARRLQDVRDRALRSGVIVQQEDDMVPARVRWTPEGGAPGEALAAEVRIKGDWLDHVQTSKWSLRIELADGAVLGMRRFSVQHPGTRAFLWEWLIQQAAAREGLLRPRSTFVNVLLNGRGNGVYFLEEHCSKELLESQGRREGPIVRFDESDLWSARLEHHIHYMRQTPTSTHLSSYPQNAPVEAFSEKRLSRSDGLARQLIAAVEELAALQRRMAGDVGAPALDGPPVEDAGTDAGDEETHPPALASALEDILDVDALARMHALMSLFRAHHGAIWHNMRFYHSPITARLEPILFDSGAGSELATKPVPWVRNDLQAAFNSSSRYYAGVFAELARMLEPDYVNDLFAALEPDLVRYEAALLRDGLPQHQSAAGLRATLLAQQDLLALQVLPQELHVAVQRADAPADLLVVEARSATRLPILLEALRLPDGRMLPARDAHLDGGALLTPDGVVLRQSGPPARLALPLSGADDPPAPGCAVGELVFRPLHVRRATTRALHLGGAPRALARFAQPTLAEALAHHACLGYDAGDDRLFLRRGTFDVDGDLVVPAGYVLRAEPSAQLRFAPGARLLAHDALMLEGTPLDPVVLGPIDPHAGWGGVHVAGAAERSQLAYVTLRKAHGAPGAGPSAALDFAGCGLTLRSSRLEGLTADVALSIRAGDLLLEGVAFGDLTGDALHAVRAGGLVDRCTFDGLGGDALVLAESSLVLRETRLARVAGRALVAGDGSSLEVWGGELADVGAACVARAGSRIELSDVGLGAAGWDAAVWTEDAWPPSVIEASGLRPADGRPLRALVQHGSSFTVDGAAWAGADVTLDALRAAGLDGR